MHMLLHRRLLYALLTSATILIAASPAMAAVNLTPYQPSDWSDKIVVSKTTGTSTDSPSLLPTDGLYIDWAVLNNGSSATTVRFYTQLLVDGVSYASWYTDPPLNSNFYVNISDYYIGSLAAGTHTVTVRTDSTGTVAESNEADNQYTKTINIGAPNLTPYAPSGWSGKIVVSKTAGTNSDSSPLTTADVLYVDWAVINNGSAATSSRFYTALSLDGAFLTSWYSDPPVPANSYVFIADYVIGPLAAGTHTLTLTTDSTGVIAETNESDNQFSKTFTVSTAGTPNLTPYQPVGWSDKIVVAKTTGTTTDAPPFAVTDTLYVDWAVVNNGNASTATRFYTELSVDWVPRISWWTDPPIAQATYVYIADYQLGALTAGTHTISIRTDSTSVISETSESDNQYTKTIVVGDNGGLYSGPATGTSAAGASVSTNSFSQFLLPLENSLNRIAEPDPPIPLVPNPDHDISTIPAQSNEVADTGAALGPGAFTAAMGTSFRAFGYTGTFPPDAHLAVGPNHIVGTVNSSFAIYTKTGTQQKQIEFDPWFANVLPALNSTLYCFDPRVLYDHNASRWIVACLASDFSSQAWMLLSVSDDSDPGGTWCNYAVRGDRNGTASASNWSDYPMIGFDDQALYVSTNQFTYDSKTFAYSKVRVIPKTQIYNSQCSAFTWSDLWDLRAPTAPSTPVFSVQPAVTFGTAPGEYLVSDSTSTMGNYITLWLLRNATGTPSLEATDVAVASAYEPKDANQLNATGNADCPAPCLLSVNGRRLLNAVYRGGYVWAAQAVAGGTNLAFTRSRYVKIATNPVARSEDSSLGVDNCWYFYPTVATDANSNLVMAYSRSCLSEYAGLAYTTRSTTDTDLRPGTTVKAGESSFLRLDDLKRNRWGDYAGAVADPADSSTVWIHGQFAASAMNTWATQIASISFSGGGCTSPSITAQPSSTTISDGQSATLSVGAAGTAPLTYQWYIGTSGQTASPISGGTASSIPVSPSSTTNYWVRVSNSCGSIDSGTATVTVTPAVCSSFSISPSGAVTASAAGSVPVTITGSPAGCTGGSWTAAGNGSWITVSPSSGSGSGSVTVSWTPNTSTSQRSGNATVSGNSFPVTQSGIGVAGFYLLTPCRLVDSRSPNGPYGGPVLAPGGVRNLVVAGQCSVPSGIKAVAVNLVAVEPTVDGWFILYPGPIGSVRPLSSNINYRTGKTVANNAIVPVAADGSINIYNSTGAATHFIIDLSGYFQ
jgi:hypothetical protein